MFMSFLSKWFKSNKKEKTCNEEINIKDIRNNFLYTNDNKIICYIKIHPLNLFLISNKEKNSIKNQLSAEFSSEVKPMKFFSIARPVEVSSVLDDLRKLQTETLNQIQKMLLRAHIGEITRLTLSGDRVERQIYLMIWQELNDYAEKDILKRAMDLSNKFAVSNIKTEILNEQEIIQLCSNFINISDTFKEDSEYDDWMPSIKEGA